MDLDKDQGEGGGCQYKKKEGSMKIRRGSGGINEKKRGGDLVKRTPLEPCSWQTQINLFKL